MLLHAAVARLAFQLVRARIEHAVVEVDGERFLDLLTATTLGRVLGQRRTIVEDPSQLQCLVGLPLVAVLEVLKQIVLAVRLRQLREFLVVLLVHWI